MKKYRVIIGGVGSAVVLSLIGWLLVKGRQFDVLAPAGSVAGEERSILITTTLLMVGIVIPIFILLGVFAWKYREGNNNTYKPNWSEDRRLELLWWGIPTIIIGSIAVITLFTTHSLDPARTLASARPPINVQVVALEWKWLFLYPDLGIASVNQLPVPVNAPIHFTLTANAPMSAFWVPALGTQIYTMNGMSSELNLIANKQGTFQGSSTNINGKGYADMKFIVQSMSEFEFKELANKTKLSQSVMKESTYHMLMQPGLAEQKLYALIDDKLYEKIVSGEHSSTMMHKMEEAQ